VGATSKLEFHVMRNFIGIRNFFFFINNKLLLLSLSLVGSRLDLDNHVWEFDSIITYCANSEMK
jgi:hypothetical protein